MGRIPQRVIDKEGLNKHRKYCVGKALQKKLSEDRQERMKHQRNDLIKNDGTSIKVKGEE